MQIGQKINILRKLFLVQYTIFRLFHQFFSELFLGFRLVFGRVFDYDKNNCQVHPVLRIKE